MARRSLIAVALLASLVIGGCSAGSQTTATPEEEQHFKNPSKEPPAEALKGVPAPSNP